MRLISGIPPWCQMYFDRLSAKAGGKKVKEIFPNFKLYVHGGVNYEPYRARMEESIGFDIDSIETYPHQKVLSRSRIRKRKKDYCYWSILAYFMSLSPPKNILMKSPTRINIKDVELDKNYALIMNTSAGLWGYSLGDTVLNSYLKIRIKIVVTGRIKHYISAFGEHVIGEEVEHALMSVANRKVWMWLNLPLPHRLTRRPGNSPTMNGLWSLVPHLQIFKLLP
jgi:hypothetical protein